MREGKPDAVVRCLLGQRATLEVVEEQVGAQRGGVDDLGADGRRHVRGRLADGNVDVGDHLPHHLGHSRRVLSPREENGELVASDPREDVGLPQSLQQRVTDRNECRVAAPASVCLIERGEIVQVEQYERGRLTVASTAPDLQGQIAHERPAAGEARQHVGWRRTRQSLGQSHEFGDVLDVCDELRNRVVAARSS